MRADFDLLIPRQGTHSLKWDASSDAGMLPMWVADMDFRTVPEVIAALEARASQGIFGYAHVPPAFYEAIIRWFSRRHHLHMKAEQLLYTTGGVPALSAIVRALTQPGDKIIVQTPGYNAFFSSARHHGCEILTSSLIRREATYEIDFADVEQKAADPHTRALLLCNPHNPVGRVWHPDELQRLGEICLRHAVIVVADEIHGDLVQPGFRFTPFASISERFMQNAITLVSPSKAFNLSGLQVAAIHVADDAVRQKIENALSIHEVCEINPFAVEALIAAYTYGETWLNALNSYLQSNYQYLKAFFTRHLPDFQVTQLEGTYLVWVHCPARPHISANIAAYLKENEKLWVNDGALYGSEGEHFIRLNIACPRERLTAGLEKIRHAFGRF